jgi:phosphate transport system substrate-binding protein
MKDNAGLIAFASFMLLVLVSVVAAQQEGGMAVIVNPENPVTSISSTDLRRIFAGDKQSWSNNLPVFPVVRAPQARERQMLMGRIMKMTEAEYKQYWLQKVYSGDAPHEPLAVFSNGMQLEAVRAKKGGIALISIQDVRQGVKVIKVDGHLPSDLAYPFQ